MIVLGLFGGLVTLLLAGLGISLLLLREQKQVNLLELGALAWLFGTGAVSIALWLGGLLLRGAPLQMGVSLLALGVGLAGFLLARGASIRLHCPRPRGVWEWFFAIVLLLQIAVVFHQSFMRGLGWDGLLNWEIKARFAFLNDGVLPAAYFSDPTRGFSHPAYPLWIPFTELWLYLWMGEANQFWINLITPCFYAAAVLLLGILAKRLTGHRWTGLAVGALFYYIPALWLEGGATSAYADLPLGVCYLTAIGFLLLHWKDGSGTSWRVFALALALLPWAKREGYILWGVGALCAVLVLWQTRGRWTLLLWLVPGPVLLAGWKIYLHANQLLVDHEFLPVTLATLTANVGRVGPLAGAVFVELGNVKNWSLFWFLVGAAFLSLLWRRRDRALVVLFLALALPLAIYPAAYIFTGWGDWLGHAHASLSRLFLHLMPLGWLAVALALRPPSAGR